MTVGAGDININQAILPERLVESIEELWDHLGTLRQPAAQERYRGRLGFHGVPNEALTLDISTDGCLRFHSSRR